MDVEAIRQYYIDRPHYWRNYHLRRWAMVIPHLIPNGTLLDVGCGYGDLFWSAFENGVPTKYTGIDLMPEHIAFAQQTMAHEEWICGDFLKYDFGDRKYDTIISVCLLSGDGWEVGDATPVIQKMLSLAKKKVIIYENQQELWPEILECCCDRPFTAKTTGFEELIIVTGPDAFTHELQQTVTVQEVRDRAR